MSHITTIELHIKDLDALREAAKQLGLEFRDNQKTYRWYGDDYGFGGHNLPAGFKRNDLGKCQHAIGLPRGTSEADEAYEIGVVARRDNQPGYALLWDADGIGGMGDAVGRGACKLKVAYTEAVGTKALRAKRFRIIRTVTPTGKVLLRGVR